MARSRAPVEASNPAGRHGQQDERERDAGDDERSPHAMLEPTAGRARGSLAEQIVEISASPGGPAEEREQGRTSSASERGEGDDAPVHRDRAEREGRWRIRDGIVRNAQ